MAIKQIIPRTGLIVLLLSAAIFAGWWQHVSKHPDAAAIGGKRGSDKEADALTIGHLRLSHCELKQKLSGATTSAYCTDFTVPEDWNDASSRRIHLNVAVVKSTAAVPERDLVVFLDGGPGQAATEDYPAIAAALAPLRASRHILLVDQRGTGGSNALSCESERTRTEQMREAGDDQRDLADIKRCLTQLSKHADPRHYTTSDAIKDLEAIRQAAGAPTLDLIGVSYGTRVAQQYARKYPEGVRSIVLDSPVPNTLALGAEHARNLEDALQAQFHVCVETPSCTQRFGDPYATLYKLRDFLRAQAQTVAVRDPVTFASQARTLTSDGLAGIVRMYAYSTETSALLPLTLDEATKGNYAPLLGQEVLVTADLSDRIVAGVQLSVICAEDIDLLEEHPEDGDTLIGNGITRSLKAACAEWPHGIRPADFHQPLQSAVPVLILAGEFDPVTPPRYGTEIASTLAHARVLIAKGQGHNVIVRGCMPKIVDEFVDKLDLGRLDTQCLDVLGPMPAFLDYSGAAP